jgi:hypothetical protein
MTKIEKDKYNQLRLGYVATTGEQQLDTGYPLVAILETDEDKYYLHLELDGDQFDEFPDSKKEAEAFCDEFGVRVCSDIDEVNIHLQNVFPEYCYFEESEFGVAGWPGC